MSLYYIILIIIGAGIIGGIINFLLPSNTDANGKRIRKLIVCIVLGTGASLFVPLFLELAQSKLMDNIRNSRMLQDTCRADTVRVQVALTTPVTTGDTPTKKQPATITAAQQGAVAVEMKECPPLKNYLLFFGYCLVAAVAGLRFINGILDSVLKDKQIADQNKKIAKTQEELDKEKLEKEEIDKARLEAEKQKTKLAMQDKKEAEEEEESVLQFAGLTKSFMADESTTGKPAIGPVINPADRQKGRFGGKAENKDTGRKISAKVSDRPKGVFYDFAITVESTDSNKPLKDKVVLFLHDSFTPSVVTLHIEDGKAVYQNIAYGAFTVGAIADGGDTLLELDLADPALGFPAEFRNR